MNARTRTIAIVCCGEVFWLLLIGVVHVHGATDKVLLVMSACLVLVIAIRSGFSYVLVLEPSQLRAKTLTRTRLWSYSELRSAEKFGTSNADDRAFIIVSPEVGRSYKFGVLSESPEFPILIDRLVEEINIRIMCASLFTNTGPLGSELPGA